MLKLFKYLKSSILSILIIIVLLMCQAGLDLSLPDYTSKIINVGIGQYGIEDSVAKVITEETLDNLSVFLTDEEESVINNNYILLEKTESNIREYPLLKKENLFIYNGKEREEVNKVLEHAFALSYVSNMISNNPDSSGIVIPEGLSFIDMLKMMDIDTRESIISNIDEKVSEMPESILKSTAIENIKLEYEHIGIDLGKMQTNYILISGAKMIGIALLIMAVSISIIFFGSRLAARLARTLRSKVFEKVVKFSKNEMKKFGTSSLITRTTNDIQQIQQVVVMLMRVVFYAPIIAIGGIIKTTRADNSMLWIIVIAVAALFIIVGTLFITVMPKFKIFQSLIDKLNLVSREILTGIPVIRAFSNERHEEKRFDEANTRLTKVNLFVNRTMALMMPLMMLLMNVVCIAIVWYGAKGVDAGTIQVGDIMAYIQYTMHIIMSFLMISMISIMLPRASISARRIIEVIETESTINDSETTKKGDIQKKGVVEFRNVCFRYPDAKEDVITDVNFIANPGETVAFIGSTGSGKSTLINLIPRFYDVTEGAILVDGVDIRNIKLKTLRDKIGYVPQKGILFSGTIESNIKYGNEKISKEKMIEAASIAQASEFINKLDNNYASNISQGGTNVSGGQRQRLSIARAIATDPEIYIFDDSFSALDFKTDAKLRKELKKVTKNSTVFIVAQRISTIMHADKIIVLDEGKVAGIGTHEELIEKCNVYKEIALSQLSKEEI
ncbi:MAG: ABC transporter ATP-binding protein [Bacilli bacterium]|nr:ABC transporter ATP-binding protein [Bacilli bacterium]